MIIYSIIVKHAQNVPIYYTAFIEMKMKCVTTGRQNKKFAYVIIIYLNKVATSSSITVVYVLNSFRTR